MEPTPSDPFDDVQTVGIRPIGPKEAHGIWRVILLLAALAAIGWLIYRFAGNTVDIPPNLGVG